MAMDASMTCVLGEPSGTLNKIVNLKKVSRVPRGPFPRRPCEHFKTFLQAEIFRALLGSSVPIDHLTAISEPAALQVNLSCHHKLVARAEQLEGTSVQHVTSEVALHGGCEQQCSVCEQGLAWGAAVRWMRACDSYCSSVGVGLCSLEGLASGSAWGEEASLG